MVCIGKLLKQTQMVQRSIEAPRADKGARETEFTAAGEASKAGVNPSGIFRKIALDSDFLADDAKVISDTAPAPIQHATRLPNDLSYSDMQMATLAFRLPVVS